MNPIIIQPLLDLILTRQDITQTMDQIDTIVEKIYTKDSTVSSVLEAVVSKEKHEAIRKILTQAGIDEGDYSAVKTFLLSIKDQLDKLPVLSITVAIEPSEVFTEKVSDWLDQNIESKVVFEFVRNSKMIGGARLSFNGMAKDYSVDNAVNAVLVQQQTTSSPQQA